MAINFKSLSQVSAVLALLFSGSQALAKDCYIESPNLETLGDDYYNLDLGQELSREEKKQAQHFFNALNGEWQGSSKQTDCLGPDSKPRKVFKEYEAKVEVSTRSESVQVKLVRRDTEQRVSRHESSTLYENNELYTIEFGEQGEVVITNKTRNSLLSQHERLKRRIIQLVTELVRLEKFSPDHKDYKKIKQQIAQLKEEIPRLKKEFKKLEDELIKRGLLSERNGKTKPLNRLREKIVELSLNKNQLLLTFLHFNNGVFVAEESFELYRD